MRIPGFSGALALLLFTLWLICATGKSKQNNRGGYSPQVEVPRTQLAGVGLFVNGMGVSSIIV